jgi:hypothetical protein
VTERQELWIVDRIEGDRAVVERSLHDVLLLPRALLPDDAREGDVLRVGVTAAAGESRLVITRDEAETRRRAADAQRLQEDLASRDPGGDLKL